MTDIVKILRFMAIKFFVFELEAFEFSKFYESKVKLEEGNIKRGLLDCEIQDQKFLKLLEKVT